MAMIKMMDFAPVDNRGEPTIRILGQRSSNIKVASENAFAPEIMDFISSLEPVLGKLYALVNAMGATEYYGCNKNGDGFYEHTLEERHPTFVSKGKPFMHHKNKDTDKFYGKVLFSAYNKNMHRVELVVEYDTNDLEKKYVDKVNNNEIVNVSMGCRVPYDICSICGHKAKTPSEYCDCLRHSPGIGRMLPDGRKAFAINTEPEFFDISIVTVPADPTARFLTKIASVDNIVTSTERAKELLKTANGAVVEYGNEDIMGDMQNLLKRFDMAMGPNLDKSLLDTIGSSNNNPIALLKAFVKNKIMLRPHEVQRIVLVSSGKREMADDLEDKKIVMLNDPGACMKYFANAEPDMHSFSSISEDAIKDRSFTPGNIKRVIIRMTLTPEEKTASTIPVDMSDDFKYLLGKEDIQANSSISANPLEALKTYLALGSIVAAFNSALSKAAAPELLKGVGLGSIIGGPSLISMLNDSSNNIGSPIQEMMFMNPDSPEAVERALMDAIDKANYRSNIKTSALGKDFGTRAIFSLPLAYGASKLVSNEAKKSDLEDAQYTGKYDKSFLSRPEVSFPIALGLLLKYGSAEKRVHSYVKTAAKHFGKQALIKNDNFYQQLHNLLFK